MILGNCLSELADSSGSISAITTLVAAVAHRHWDQFLPSPTENFGFRRLLQGFKKRLTKPPKKKDPLTPEILSSAIQLVRPNGKLQEWRTVTRMCLSFYAGCRWSDAAYLKLSHLKFDAQGVAITIPKSKTDQLSRGDTVFMQYSDTPYCPVTLLQDYIAKLRYGDRDGYIQPRIATHNGVQSGIWNTTVSYSTALSDLKLLLSSLGLDPSRYGEHSGRRGGATAASDAGVDWPDLMLHGRWKSMATPLGYLANARKKKRKVATALAQLTAPSATDAVVASPVQPPSSAAPPPVSVASTSAPAIPTSAPSSSVSSSSRFYFQPLSNADWVQVKRRYTGQYVPLSDPPPMPRTETELLAASALASMIDSPNQSPSHSVTSSNLDAFFEDDADFDIPNDKNS